MLSADGAYTIVFNGEIYNFLELRKELEHEGSLFRSDSDTEVILEAWRRWGEGMLLRFNGMWALAIYDNRTNETYFSRDRYGIKPLLYANTAQGFAFASEMRALRSLPWLDSKLDADVTQRMLFDPFSIEGSDRSSLTRNDISGFINGICLASSHAVIAGNRLVDNHFGLYIDPGIEDIEVRHNLIDRNNRVEARAPQLRTGTGIMIEGARDVRAFGNMITNNTADNLANGIPLGAAGIIVRDSSPTVLASNISVRFNTITGNGLSADGVVYPGGSDVINIATGSSVAIEYNVCGTSRPAALC